MCFESEWGDSWSFNRQHPKMNCVCWLYEDKCNSRKMSKIINMWKNPFLARKIRFLASSLCKLSQLGHGVVLLVLPGPHACTSLHNFIMYAICRRPHSCRQDRKKHTNLDARCVWLWLVMNTLAIKPYPSRPLGVSALICCYGCRDVFSERTRGWLLGVSDVADWCKVHSH